MSRTKLHKKIFSLFSLAFSSVLGIGYFPKAPGTAASVAAVLFVFIFKNSFSQILWGVIILTGIGVYLATLAEKVLKKTDPGLIVIDEWIGQWIALLPLVAMNLWEWPYYFLALIFFRFFDIKKPLGIKYLQELPGGWGIMADDVLAGIYAALLVYAATLI